jgi:hypothetical protein
LLHGDFYNGAFFASNRLFVDATAFLTASQLLDDPKPLVYARQFLAQALSRETAAGVFPEEGGYDSSYQAASLLHATYFLLRDPSAPGLRAGIAKALRREVRSVDSTGTLIVLGNTLTALSSGSTTAASISTMPPPRKPGAAFLRTRFISIRASDADGLDCRARVLSTNTSTSRYDR